MAEYIDKNKVVLNYGGLAKIAPNDNAGIAKYFADQIKAIPAADVAPVRHGRWIAQTDYPGTYAKCSECGCRCRGYVPNYHYCPDCGAKMDGGADNG